MQLALFEKLEIGDKVKIVRNNYRFSDRIQEGVVIRIINIGEILTDKEVLTYYKKLSRIYTINVKFKRLVIQNELTSRIHVIPVRMDLTPIIGRISMIKKYDPNPVMFINNKLK